MYRFETNLKVGISGEMLNLTLTTSCECDCGQPQNNAQQVFFKQKEFHNFLFSAVVLGL